jgi:hypothetical protein
MKNSKDLFWRGNSSTYNHYLLSLNVFQKKRYLLKSILFFLYFQSHQFNVFIYQKKKYIFQYFSVFSFNFIFLFLGFNQLNFQYISFLFNALNHHHHHHHHHHCRCRFRYWMVSFRFNLSSTVRSHHTKVMRFIDKEWTLFLVLFWFDAGKVKIEYLRNGKMRSKRKKIHFSFHFIDNKQKKNTRKMWFDSFFSFSRSVFYFYIAKIPQAISSTI